MILIFSLISFCCSLAFLYLGITAYTLDRRNKTNIIFLAYCLTAAALAFFEFMARQALAYPRGYLWINLQQIVPLVTIISLHFIIEYTKNKKNRDYPYFHVLLYVPLIVYLFFLIFTDIFRVNAVMAPWGFSHAGNENTGFFPYIVILWMICMNIAAIAMSFTYFSRQKDKESRQAALYVFTATLLPFVGAIIENTILKSSGKIPELITIFTLAGAFFLACAIHRHRLFEINPEMAAVNILRTIDSYVLLVDTGGIIKYANPAIFDALGLPKTTLINEKISTIFMNGFMPGFLSGLDAGAALSKEVKNSESCLVSSAGKPLYVLMSVSPSFDSAGALTGYVIAAVNINQRIALENNLMTEISRADMANAKLEESNQKLKELDRMKKNFIAIVSHELRTPLTSIKGFLSFLSHGVGGNLSAKQREFTDTMGSNVEKLLKLINELLDFSKIDSGTFSVDRKNSDLAITARKAIIEMEPIAAKKGIRLVDLIEKPSLPGFFDDTRIGQVIINLLNNAVKYTYSGTSIFISLEEIDGPQIILPDYLKSAPVPAGRYFLLTVRDEGPGMDPKYCRKIFDQFYQIEDANTRKHEGVGLGLNISMNIIKAHSGFIWAESKGKDTGASFYFMIPAVS